MLKTERIKQVCLTLLLATLVTTGAQANGFRQQVAVDLVSLAQAQPNLEYERRFAVQWTAGARLRTRLLELEKGIELTPFVRYSPRGALRSGFVGELGVLLPTEAELAGSLGLGYSVWMDRLQVTPAVQAFHTGDFAVRVDLGFGWY